MKTRLLVVACLLAAAGLACSAGNSLLQPAPVATLAPVATEALTHTPAETATPLLIDTAVPTETAIPTETAAPSPSEAPTSVPTAAGPRPSPSPLQMQTFEQLWQTVNQNYLYRDFNGLDWNAVHADYQARIAAGMSDEAFYQAMDQMVKSLGDDHSSFFSPEEARQMDAEFAGQYQYVGIGVFHTPTPEHKLFSIVLVFPGSPAEEAGLKPHDNILAVDGKPVFDDQGNRQDLLRGPEGTTITLTVQTPGQAPREVQITRRPVLTEIPVPHQVIVTPAGKRIGYLMIPTFNESGIDQRVGQALQEMAGGSGSLDGLILDNRHNSGGQDEIMLHTLAYFTGGQVGYFVQRDQRQPIQVTPVDMGGSQTLPLVVLVGEGTASFGEVFSGILKDLGRATVIGTVTDGNVELLSVFDLMDNSRAWIATGSFRPLNDPDQNWEQTGIIPDINVDSQWDAVTFETDPAIQAAVQYLGQ